jgi:hypothetical protein
MPKTTNTETASRHPDSVEHQLARLLDAPFLDRVVPRLAPETLHRLVQSRGLEACGELVTCATPAQLTSLLDLDLWHRAQPGRDEEFDVERFGEWLEVLVDAGESVAARTVAALDEHLVIVGLCRYVRVLDPGTFEPTAPSDDETADRSEMMNGDGSGNALECEVGGYLVRARRTDAWDAIVALLVALEAGHDRCFHAVMQGCRRLSNSTPEIDGLDDLLTAPEQHLHDVAIERERRRSRQGYTTPSDARAFLHMARQPPQTPFAVNPIAAAYFRAGEEEAGAAGAPSRGGGESDDIPMSDDTHTPIEAVLALLAEAGMMPEQPRALLAAAGQDAGAAKLPILRRLMEFALHHDETAYLARSRELAFLANTLMAGCSIQSRPFTPGEASDAAASICNLGLDMAPLPDAFLVDHDLVTAFEAGWSVLYHGVSLFAADRLVSALGVLRCADADIRRDLRALQRALAAQRDAGTPWRARGAADVLAMFDMTAWIGVLGLLDECPVLPAALAAVLEGRTSSVSPTAFEFISARTQIDDIRRFVNELPRVLSR